MYRYHPQIRELARIVRDQGLIGEVRLVVSSFTWPIHASGDVRLDASLDGGSLLDVGVYCVSAARLLAGEPRTVAAHQVLGPTGVDVSFAAPWSSVPGLSRTSIAASTSPTGATSR